MRVKSLFQEHNTIVIVQPEIKARPVKLESVHLVPENTHISPTYLPGNSNLFYWGEGGSIDISWNCTMH